MIVRPVVCRTLIGRDEELAFIDEQRLRAGRSRGGTIAITGEPGIGKSRLIAEFCRTLAGSRWRIGSAACLENAQRPYGPVLEILAALDGEVALLPAATKREQFDAIGERFASASAKRALILVIEDLHWADSATIELLTFLAPIFLRSRILALVSLRPADDDAGDPALVALARFVRVSRASRIELGPLDDAAMRRFVDEAARGHELSEDARIAVLRTCEGNPFFAEELLRFAIERRDSGNAAIADTELPSSIRATVLERWHVLDEADRAIISQAAVIGRTFDLGLLARTLDREIDLLLPALARARELQLIDEFEPTTFRFRHALTRTAIYGGFLQAAVRSLHRRIATVLEEAPPTERSLEGLAYHWWAAGDDEPRTRYNELAGDAATEVFAHDDAILLYERAIESSELALPTRGRLVEKIADRCVAIAAPHRANREYERAATIFERVGDVESEARCRVRCAITAYTIGLGQPIAPLVAMLERLDANDYVVRARVHLGIAWLAATFWYPTQARKHIDDIDPRAAALPELAFRFHNISAWIAMTINDVATFRREHAAWVDYARRDGGFGAHASALYNGAYCFAILGLHDEAAANVELALAVTREEKNSHGVDSTFGIAAECFLLSGRLERAREALARVPTATSNVVTLASAVASGLVIGDHLDDRALVDHWFAVAGDEMIAHPDEACGAGLATELLRRGRDAEARNVLSRAIIDCEAPRGAVRTLLVAAEHAAQEDVARARALLAAAASGNGEPMERPALALFDAYCERRAGRREQARAHARAAAQGFARLDFPLFEAAAREAAGEREAARLLYERCGAVRDANRLMRAGRRERADAPPAAQSAQSDAFGPLSSREREIAIIAAQGRTNGEIAHELAISAKTVEKHLGSIYLKLGLSSRVQLASALARMPSTATPEPENSFARGR